MSKYFLRVDYIYKGASVQRLRTLCYGYADVTGVLGQYAGDDYMVLAVKVERCS